LVEAREDPGLGRKLSWITLFRLVIVSVLLGGTALVAAEGPDLRAQLEPLFVVAGGVYAASVVFGFALRRKRGLVLVAYAQIGLDVAVATVVVWMTGGPDSMFLFMFSMAAVNGAILRFSRGAAVAGGLSIAGYLVAALGRGGPAAHGVTLFTHGAAFTATAYLAAYLAEQLRATGERLAASEGDLAALAGLHEAVVQSMTAGLITLDPDGRVTFANEAAERLMGVPVAELRGERIGDLFPALLQGERGEAEHARRDGERVTLGYSRFPLTARGGTPGSAVLFQDLTRLRRMEDAVQRAERLADLGRLSAGLAHEIRNPMASMSGAIELLRGHTGASEDDRRLMDIVLREAVRLNDLVTQFLGFARPAAPRRAPTDVAVLLHDTVRVVRNDPHAAGIEIQDDLAPAVAECDADQIRQVAWNLLLNAAQAIAQSPANGGGRIRVACGAMPDGVRIEVEDDGPGIAPPDLDKLFIPFFTTKARGTGLGLATVHRIVDAHGGSVRVTSTPGRGTRFAVTLPAPAEASG